jgi:outer membrane protein OmpA-like peptidoglycan-associated protein
VSPTGCELDSDSDGVVDSADECSNTPAGITVTDVGCEIDSDKDGVVDSNDQCANTPSGVTVSSSGCEIDSDKDGVVDSIDQCAGSLVGVAVTNIGCEIDSDMDGIADSMDQCAETSTGISVGQDGCEIDSDADGIVDSADLCVSAPLVVVDQKGCEIDTDGDGLIDSQDACPESLPGSEIGKDGCMLPSDEDKDGVADEIDVCLNSKFGTDVNQYGCESEQNIVLKGIRFKSNSDELTHESALILADLSDRLYLHPYLKLEIAGHTDNLGDEIYNMDLSNRRANIVKAFLVEHGIAIDNIKAIGYGQTRPITDNNSVAKRYINRRVELSIKPE